MDALNINKKFLGLCLFAVSACSNGGSEIDATAKRELLSNTVILASVKQQCLPLAIVDEEDIPLLDRQGYTVSPNNEYCLPPIDTDDGDSTVSNCIREIFVDDTDLAYLISVGYVPNANGDYCLVIGGGSGGSTTGATTTGGSTTGSETGGSTTAGATSGSDTGGTTSGGSTTGSETGGSTTAGATSGSDTGGTTSGGSTTGSETGGSTTAGATSGSDTGGTTSGGSTTGSDTGGSTTAGATSGSDTGGTISGGSTSGGSTTGSDTGGSTTAGATSGSDTGGTISGGTTSGGSTTGSDTGGSTSGGSTTGGSTTGGSTGGSTSGGSTGGECKKGNNGHGNDRDGNDSSNPGRSNNGDGTDDDGVPGQKCPPDDCEMNLIPGLQKEAQFKKCAPWNVPVDRVCSRIRTSSGRFKLNDRLELVMRVVKRVETVQEVEVCKAQRTGWIRSGDDDDDDNDSHTHKASCKHEHKKVVCKMEKKKVVSMVPICESRNTDKIKNDVINKKRLDLSDCDISGHKKSELYVTLFSPVVGGDLPVKSSEYENVRLFAKDSDKRGKEEISFIMYGSRDVRFARLSEKIQVIIDDNPDFNSKVDKKKCDMKASPLIVHVNPKHDVARYVELSSIADGIQFNILGFNAEPRKNARHQISWLNTDQYMFLVKPNKKGRVEGVDEMFGDNTRGPDKDFSANGFLALAKFDSNGDGLINSKDSVFKSLRLWKDKNFDGIGTRNELVSLDQMSVKNIDLNYDPGFYERDAHGNETVYKSVIQYQDGSLDLIFDLWFNYKK